MTKNVTVGWKLPIVRQGGATLPPDEIQHVLPEMSADGGASFGNLAVVLPADPQLVRVPDMEPGEWHFRFTVLDTLGQSSPVHDEVVTVIDDSPPGPITDVTVTQE
jgi:hypothetical protein